jgi:glycosyltransferase involved in cell wall biosynthesis
LRTFAHVIDYGGTTGGSFIPALARLGTLAAERGDRLVVVATDVAGATWPTDLRRAGIQLELVRSAPEALRKLSALAPAIVHSHFTRYDLPILGVTGAKLFWHVHSHREDLSVAARIRAWLKYRVLGRAVTAFVAVSREIGDEIVAWSGPAARVEVILNGIDVDRFRPPSQAERRSARHALGIAPDDRVALFFERVAYKGGATVRAALGGLAPGTRLLVAGGPPAARAAFEALPGAIVMERAADARALYWAADALAFASDREAFGYVLVEALACGLPIAASDIPIVTEICAGVPSVVRFPVGNAAALARALENAMERDGRGLGRSRAIECFDVTVWAERMLRLYDGRSDAGHP